MLVTDVIAVTLGLLASLILIASLVRANARLEKQNAYLRNQLRDMRKQIANMVERPF